MNVGDKVKVVRIIEDDYGKPYFDIPIGTVGEVIQISDIEYNDIPYLVHFKTTVSNGSIGFNELEIEKVEDE